MEIARGPVTVKLALRGICIFGLIMMIGLGSVASAGSASKPKRAKGATFTVPIPAGFSQSTDPKYQMIEMSGGIILLQSTPTGSKTGGKVQGQIVVAPMLKVKPGFNPTDPAVCEKMATDTAKAIEAKLTEHGIIGAPFGRTCQFTSHDEKELNRATTLTVVYSRSEYWGVTCTYDLRDPSALAACKAVVAGWLFSP